MGVRGAAFRDIRGDPVHRQHSCEHRAVSAPLGIDHSHLRRILPRHREGAHARRGPVHLGPGAARRVQLDMLRPVRIGPTAQRKQTAFQRADVIRRIKLRVPTAFIDLYIETPCQLHQARKAEIHRCKEQPVRRAVFIRFDGKRERSCARGKGEQIARKRLGDHVKPVDEHMRSGQHAGCAELSAHLFRHILVIRELSRHPGFIGRKQARHILELAARRAYRMKLLHAHGQILRGEPASPHVRDQRAELLHKARRSALRSGAVDGQILLLRLDDLGEDHAPAALVEHGLHGLSGTLEYAAPQPRGRQHVDQE